MNDYDLYECIDYLEEHRVISELNAQYLRCVIDVLYYKRKEELRRTDMRKCFDYFIDIDRTTKMWKLKLYFNDFKNPDYYDIEYWNLNCYNLDNAISVANILIEDWIKLGLIHFDEFDGFDNHINRR